LPHEAKGDISGGRVLGPDDEEVEEEEEMDPEGRCQIYVVGYG